MKLTRDLRTQWRLLVVAFVVGGIFEVVDNLLGLRTLNFQSSAPTVFKVTKELAIAWLLLGAARSWGWPRLTRFGLGIGFVVLATFLPQFFALPSEPYALVGLIYFAASTLMLLVACAIYRPGMEAEFVRDFIVPVLVITLLTQLLEAQLAPGSLYFESNLLGLDRRAGIAAIPTTAGLLGVVGFAATRGPARVLSLFVIAMANSTLSLLCLVMVLIARMRKRPYMLLALPCVVLLGAFVIAGRQGLDVSVSTRLGILSDSLTELAWFGPSPLGALVTAKSVALAPFDSYIIDSFYLEVLHIFGIVPGVLLIGALFATLYRRVGGLALTVFAITGLGYLVLEAWIVWISIIFGLPRRPRGHTPVRHLAMSQSRAPNSVSVPIAVP